jgi:hypothetical protein
MLDFESKRITFKVSFQNRFNYYAFIMSQENSIIIGGKFGGHRRYTLQRDSNGAVSSSSFEDKDIDLIKLMTCACHQTGGFYQAQNPNFRSVETTKKYHLRVIEDGNEVLKTVSIILD